MVDEHKKTWNSLKIGKINKNCFNCTHNMNLLFFEQPHKIDVNCSKNTFRCYHFKDTFWEWNGDC